MAWSKYVIVDQTVKASGRNFSYGFSGFDGDQEKWAILPDHYLLYNDVEKAFADFDKIKLPAAVLMVSIDRGQCHINRMTREITNKSLDKNQKT